MSDLTREPAPAARGRRRFSAQEVEERMAKTAERLLITEVGGLSVSLEHINMEVLIGAAGVPRSSVYRLWPTKEQFISFFLQKIVSATWFTDRDYDRETIELVVSSLQERADLLATREGRRDVLRALIRVPVERNYRQLVESLKWRTTVAITVTSFAMSEPDAQRNLIEELHRSEVRFTESMASFYQVMTAYVGYRIKAPYSYEQLTTCGAAVLEGLSLRSMIGFEAGQEKLQVNSTRGSSEDWTLAALAFLAIFESMLEEDPDYEVMDSDSLAQLKAADPGQMAAALIGAA